MKMSLPVICAIQLLSLLIFLIALIALIGSLLHITYLASWVPGYTQMAIPTEICFMCVSAALFIVGEKLQR